MRPHVYGITAGSVLTTALLIAPLAGCAGDAPPTGEASATPGVSVPSATTAAPSPSPSAELREPHTLVFSATGTAAVVSVTYEFDGRKTTQRSVSLPWRKVVEVPADGKRHRWGLTITHRSGRVELVAFFNGAVAGRSEGQVSGANGIGTSSVVGTVRG